MSQYPERKNWKERPNQPPDPDRSRKNDGTPLANLPAGHNQQSHEESPPPVRRTLPAAQRDHAEGLLPALAQGCGPRRGRGDLRDVFKKPRREPRQPRAAAQTEELPRPIGAPETHPKGWRETAAPGDTTLEEKLLQAAVAQILSAIYEADFLPCSYGYRPGRSPHDAVTALTDTLFRGHFEFVVEADIRGYFEHIQHDWRVQMLELRIDDAALVGLIRKWLRAGILLEDGRIEHPETGTPQGGSVTPWTHLVSSSFSPDCR